IRDFHVTGVQTCALPIFLFSIIIAPFAMLPDWLGIVLWNVANAAVFIYAIHKLPFSNQYKAFFAWLCLQEFITAAVSLQFNIARSEERRVGKEYRTWWTQ